MLPGTLSFCISLLGLPGWGQRMLPACALLDPRGEWRWLLTGSLRLWPSRTPWSLPGNRPLPRILWFNSSSTQITVSDARCRSCFTDERTPARWKILRAWWSWHVAPTPAEGFMMDQVNRCDTLSESCAGAAHGPWDAPPSAGLLTCFAEAQGGVEGFEH